MIRAFTSIDCRASLFRSRHQKMKRTPYFKAEVVVLASGRFQIATSVRTLAKTTSKPNALR